MARIEFPLGQGWYKNLSINFEDAESSQNIDLSQSCLFSKQVHGNQIHVCTPADLTKGASLAEADGLIADETLLKNSKSKMLIQTADCLPLVYVEREQKKIALVHAGWKGLSKKIHLRPFDSYGFKAANTLLWVGPSINGKNFEVGPDVWTLFPDFAEDAEVFEPNLTENTKKFFHVWNYLEKVFAKMNVELLYKTEVDTFVDPSFASYRRAKREGTDNTLARRNYTWVAFAPQ